MLRPHPSKFRKASVSYLKMTSSKEGADNHTWWLDLVSIMSSLQARAWRVGRIAISTSSQCSESTCRSLELPSVSNISLIWKIFNQTRHFSGISLLLVQHDTSTSTPIAQATATTLLEHPIILLPPSHTSTSLRASHPISRGPTKSWEEESVPYMDWADHSVSLSVRIMARSTNAKNAITSEKACIYQFQGILAYIDRWWEKYDGFDPPFQKLDAWKGNTRWEEIEFCYSKIARAVRCWIGKLQNQNSMPESGRISLNSSCVWRLLTQVTFILPHVDIPSYLKSIVGHLHQLSQTTNLLHMPRGVLFLLRWQISEFHP